MKGENKTPWPALIEALLALGACWLLWQEPLRAWIACGWDLRCASGPGTKMALALFDGWIFALALGLFRRRMTLGIWALSLLLAAISDRIDLFEGLIHGWLGASGIYGALGILAREGLDAPNPQWAKTIALGVLLALTLAQGLWCAWRSEAHGPSKKWLWGGAVLGLLAALNAHGLAFSQGYGPEKERLKKELVALALAPSHEFLPKCRMLGWDCSVSAQAKGLALNDERLNKSFWMGSAQKKLQEEPEGAHRASGAGEVLVGANQAGLLVVARAPGHWRAAAIGAPWVDALEAHQGALALLMCFGFFFWFFASALMGAWHEERSARALARTKALSARADWGMGWGVGFVALCALMAFLAQALGWARAESVFLPMGALGGVIAVSGARRRDWSVGWRWALRWAWIGGLAGIWMQRHASTDASGFLWDEMARMIVNSWALALWGPCVLALIAALGAFGLFAKRKETSSLVGACALMALSGALGLHAAAAEKLFEQRFAMAASAAERFNPKNPSLFCAHAARCEKEESAGAQARRAARWPGFASFSVKEEGLRASVQGADVWLILEAGQKAQALALGAWLLALLCAGSAHATRGQRKN